MIYISWKAHVSRSLLSFFLTILINLLQPSDSPVFFIYIYIYTICYSVLQNQMTQLLIWKKYAKTKLLFLNISL